MARISWWGQEIAEIVCMFEKELSMSFMDLQVHILIHLVDEVELVEVVSCDWMFFLESYMKKLKGFVRQREKPRGLWQRGTYHLSLYIMPVSTSSRLSTHQVRLFGMTKGMNTKEKGSL
jgi:hypothetical protein